MKSSSIGDSESPRAAGRSAVDQAKDAFIGGLAVVVPFLVTVVVLATIVQYVVNYLYAFLGAAPNTEPGPVMTVIVLLALLVFVLVVGFVTQFRYGELFVEYVDAGLSSIPGFGTIYDSFREMSDVMMESDQQSFRDVKLVEFPHEGAYTLGFLTAESAGALKDAAGREDLVTLFLPLAPNPVMGGHLVHVPAGRVMDVDMSVDEGLRTVVTSGVATGGPRDAPAHGGGLSADQLERLGVDAEPVVDAGASAPGDADEGQQATADAATRESAYEEYAAPDSADEEPVPSQVESYREDETLGEGTATPGALETENAGTVGEGGGTPSDVVPDRDGSESLQADDDGSAAIDAGADGARTGDESREEVVGQTSDESQDETEELRGEQSDATDG